MTLDEAIAIAKESSEDESMGDHGREDYKQLAAWLEELKQYKEEKPETNLDHYRREILENYVCNLAVVDGRPKPCTGTRCSNCEFNKKEPKRCPEKRIEWLNEQYIKPTYELTKFEFDLLQSYPGKYKFKDIPVLDRMKEKEYFKGADEDTRIKDILADCEITEED